MKNRMGDMKIDKDGGMLGRERKTSVKYGDFHPGRMRKNCDNE